ncbi:TonB-dependent receptor [Sphingomonas sp.]|uniref:TonB-dependent receptor n=1 Tax=Sphingomonas sp. TaxID=28214 RepID=UPI003D6CFD53
MLKFSIMSSTYAISVALLAAPALAQTVSPAEGDQPASEQAEDTGLGDIVVTAQRRTETLLKVPASVEVLSGDRLQAAHINNLANIQEVSPSLIVTQSSSPSTGVFTVRGIGTAVTDRGFEQSVGVYIDGVFRGRPGTALQDLLNIERVEVLRGPQSTLFGRNNSAGAINISTALPNANAFGVYAEGTYGNYDTIQARLSVNLPLVTDKLALSIAMAENYNKGFVEAPNLPQGRTNGRDRQSIRAQLYWTPTDQTRVRLIGDYSQLDDSCCSYLPLFVSDAAANAPFVFNVRGGFIGYTAPTPGTRGVSPSNPASPGTFYRPFDRRTTQDSPSGEKTTDKGVSLQVDQDFGNLTLTAIGAHRRFQSNVSLDIDGVDSAVANVRSSPSTNIRETSAEVRLQNAAGSPVEFVVGGYYFNQKIIDRNLLQIRVKPAATTVTFYNSTGTGTAESGAVFGQATYNVTSSLRVTGGLRYLKEKKTGVVTVAPGSFSFPGTAERNDDALMGSATIAFQPVPEANLYLRYARGYKSGAINLLLTSPTNSADPSVDPETTDAFEAGAKFRLFGDRLSTNIAVYTQTVNDQQVQAFNSQTSSFVTLNAAKVRARGVEAELLYRPVKPLTFNASLSYLDAKYLSFPGAPPPAGGTVPSQDLTGRTPPNAPRWTLVGGVSLDQPLSDKVRLLGNVNLRHATSYYTDLPLTEAFRNGNTDFLSASVELALRNGFGIQFWGRNLTRQNSYLSGIGTPLGSGSLAVFVNEPRTYGLTLRFRH